MDIRHQRNLAIAAAAGFGILWLMNRKAAAAPATGGLEGLSGGETRVPNSQQPWRQRPRTREPVMQNRPNLSDALNIRSTPIGATPVQVLFRTRFLGARRVVVSTDQPIRVDVNSGVTSITGVYVDSSVPYDFGVLPPAAELWAVSASAGVANVGVSATQVGTAQREEIS